MYQYNISVHKATKVVPFVLFKGYDPLDQNWGDLNRHFDSQQLREKNMRNIEGYRLEYNGMDITKPEEEQLKQLNSKLDKNDILDSASFGKRVLNSKFTMVKDSNPQVRNAADLYTDVTTVHYKRYLASKNLSEEINQDIHFR